MSLIFILLVLIVIGIVLWLVNTYAPIDPGMKSIVIGVAVIIALVWLISALVPGRVAG